MTNTCEKETKKICGFIKERLEKAKEVLFKNDEAIGIFCVFLSSPLKDEEQTIITAKQILFSTILEGMSDLLTYVGELPINYEVQELSIFTKEDKTKKEIEKILSYLEKRNT
jgi:hypothetical protein